MVMMRGQPYSTCKLYYDGAQQLEPGQYLRTPGGSVNVVSLFLAIEVPND